MAWNGMERKGKRKGMERNGMTEMKSIENTK